MVYTICERQTRIMGKLHSFMGPNCFLHFTIFLDNLRIFMGFKSTDLVDMLPNNTTKDSYT